MARHSFCFNFPRSLRVSEPNIVPVLSIVLLWAINQMHRNVEMKLRAHTINIFTLQTRKPRLKDIKYLAQNQIENL